MLAFIGRNIQYKSDEATFMFCVRLESFRHRRHVEALETVYKFIRREPELGGGGG